MNRLKMWEKQGEYRSFKTNKPMILINENGKTILEPLYKSKKDYSQLIINALKRVK